MCEKCLHNSVCKYRDNFIKFEIKIPTNIEAIVKAEVSCIKFKDERYYKVVRPMGTEV